jgi:hypothetical protein
MLVFEYPAKMKFSGLINFISAVKSIDKSRKGRKRWEKE